MRREMEYEGYNLIEVPDNGYGCEGCFFESRVSCPDCKLYFHWVINKKSPYVRETEEGPIKPCPFCGGEGKLFNDVLVYGDTAHIVYCKECGCQTQNHFTTDEQAIEAWNRRVEK